MDETEYQQAIGVLADSIEASTQGRFRCPYELLTRLVALLGKVRPRYSFVDCRQTDAGVNVEVVLVTEQAVIRACRPADGDASVVAFPRSGLDQVEVTGGDLTDWGDLRTPAWPPRGRLRLTYRGRDPFEFPLGDEPMSPHQRLMFGEFAQELVNDFGR